MLRAAFAEAGWTIDHSEAGLYLWATHPAHDCWSAAEWLAAEAGILVAPGELYGPAGGAAHPGGADRHRRADRRRRGAAGRAASLNGARPAVCVGSGGRQKAVAAPRYRFYVWF